MHVKSSLMARGWQMPGPEQYKICKCPTPGTDEGSKCPAVVRGGGGRGVWAQLELTGALASSKFWAFSKKKITKKQCSLKPFFTGNNSFNPKNEQSNSIEKKQVHFSVGCLWHSHGKNPVRLYPKLQSQPIGLCKIFIDYLFFQADQSDCTKSVSISNRFASSEER